MASLLETYGPPSPELARRLVLLLGLMPRPEANKADESEQPPAASEPDAA